MDDLTYAMLKTRAEQLRREAALDRLARVARCCRPSRWRRARTAAAERLHRSTQPC
jgi:hypothetical protein